jgi:SAM-dependent methyltransferase
VNPLLVDVGAGTGKASAPFVERDVRVISIEPSRSMIAQGIRSYPRLNYICSAAEELPIASASATVVTCAQAFHWLDAPRALQEFARVLRNGGWLCLFWNTRDLRQPAAAAFDQSVRKWNPAYVPEYRQKDWGELIRRSGLFPTIAYRQFRFAIPMTVHEWIGLSRSISYVQAIGAESLPGFESELEERLHSLPSTECTYISDLWTASTRD